MIFSDRRSPSAMCEFPFVCWRVCGLSGHKPRHKPTTPSRGRTCNCDRQSQQPRERKAPDPEGKRQDQPNADRPAIAIQRGDLSCCRLLLLLLLLHSRPATAATERREPGEMQKRERARASTKRRRYAVGAAVTSRAVGGEEFDDDDDEGRDTEPVRKRRTVTLPSKPSARIRGSSSSGSSSRASRREPEHARARARE